MKLGYKRPLTDKDIWKLDTWDQTETLNKKYVLTHFKQQQYHRINHSSDICQIICLVNFSFQRCWAEESQRSKPWLLRALNRCLGGR